MNLIISGVTYHFPLKQTEITYGMGCKIDTIMEEYPDFKTNIEGKKWFLASLLCADYDIIDLMTDEQINVLVDNHSFFQPSNADSIPKHIKIKGKIYKYQDFSTIISVERYSELDQLAIDKDEKGLYMSLYQPIKKKLNLLGLRNYNDITEINYYTVRLAINYYYKWKLDLLNEYQLNYHNPQIPADQQSDKVELLPHEKFGVYHILMNVVSDDYDKMLNWLNRDIKDLFKFLLYIRIKSFTEKK